MSILLQRGLVLVGTLLTAAVASTVTAANVYEVNAPQLAARLIPCSGEARADLALQLVVNASPSAGDLTRAESLSREALGCEPLLSGAVNVLGMVALHREDYRLANRYLKQAESLSRRDIANHLLLIETAVAADDVPTALHRYDVALRSSAAASDALFPRLADAMADAGLRPRIIALLRTNPPWLERFIYAASDVPTALPILPEVVKGLAGKFDPPEPLRTHILARLIREEQYGPADYFYKMLSGAPANALRQVRDSKFQNAGRWPPFDWEMTESGQIGAAVDSSGTGLTAFSNGSTGTAARQLLALQPGRYQLISQAKLVREERPFLAWQIMCARKDGAVIGQLPLPATGETAKLAAPFTVPADCQYQWLSLQFPEEGGRYLTASVDWVTALPY